MARWKLKAAHYLNCPGTEMEIKESFRGQTARKVIPVPRYLDPANPADWSHKWDSENGDVIVCHAGRGEPRDIVFVGEPTPDMEPLDAEASEISASLAKKWGMSTDALFGDGEETYGQRIEAALASQAAEVPAEPRPDLDRLEKLIEKLSRDNALLAAQVEELSARQTAESE